jgi:hypothetical protein
MLCSGKNKEPLCGAGAAESPMKINRAGSDRFSITQRHSGCRLS